MWWRGCTADNWGRRARARAARCVLVLVVPQPRVTHRTQDSGVSWWSHNHRSLTGLWTKDTGQVCPQPQPQVTHRTLDTGYRCVLNHGGVTHRTCLTNAILKYSLDSGYRKSIRLDVISIFDLGHAGNPFGYIYRSPIWSIFFNVSHHQCSKKYKLNNAQTQKWNSSSGSQKSYTWH